GYYCSSYGGRNTYIF
nr:immunoglobulin light chain junction region [Macaca mulatta]MOW15267.1 immunoglobulin light chain junction region [Macaca mulatta]MOW15659.1 immunoglobulin light chain junction region [Macaca mulatta]MOW16142.1 immunoglobulin light chain junction region [Macaca mulatta]MOW16447.1 immunoglobulin light chain junction region [Macaca mulatta]